ncbi:MAG: ACP S-malonyltransferase [Acidobacteriota bacterium]|nr:ACP S-malonyltransferase [Acidobacteriota bacterium]
MIAFVFPGQGSQRVGMGRALCETFPVCRQTFEEADQALGDPISRLCFDGPEEQLALTRNTQPAVLAASVAVDRLLRSRGHAPAFLAGHSLGEYSAHVAAGTLGLADALRTVRRRGTYMQEAVPVGEGAMAAVLGLPAERVSQACAEVADGQVVSAANLNAPGQVAIAGHAAAVERAGLRARALGARRVMPLPVSAPFHCALMKPAEERLAPELRALVVADPAAPVVANVDAEPKRTGREAVEALIRQVSAPVRWEDVVRRLVADGVTTFIEVGPGGVLSGLIRKIDRSVSATCVHDPSSLESAETTLRARG